MDLKSVLTGKEQLEFYWALVVEANWVQAGIWSTKQGKANVVSIGPSAAWETDEELVNACDSCLSAAIQSLPEDVTEPTKTVFGVSSSWVSEGQIKPEFLDKIKKICSSLSLTPVGFVVLGEAISFFMKSDEGVPLNAIVIGVGEENIEISVFKLGNLLGTHIVSRSVSIVDDLTEGISRFASEDALPSRILIYDGKEGQLEEVRQSLMNASWDDYEKVKFLHTPKIEIVTPEQKILATALAGGAEIANVTGVEKPFEPKEEKEEEELKESEVVNVETPKAIDLGFVMDKDIRQESDVKPEIPPQENKEFLPNNKEEVSPQERQFIPASGVLPLFKIKAVNLIRKISSKINLFLEKFGAAKGYGVSGGGKTFLGKRVLFLGLGAFIILLISGIIFWWYYPKATVTIYVSPEKLDQTETVFVDPSTSSVDFEKRILPGEFITEKADGEKTQDTSGTKTVGDKAKGEITLYRSGSEISLKAGTIITGPGSLEFTLDDGVTVASGSASSPSTTKAQVTAEDIGAQYNLAGGETFSVSNYPRGELEAKNDSAFSGGSSREISAVSQDDQDKLESDLKKELEEKAIEQISSNLSSDKYFIKESVQTTILDETFSNKVGDEASTLKISLSVEVKGLVVNKSNLYDLAKEALKGKVSQGYALREDQITVSFEYVEEDINIYELEANYVANLLPEVNSDKIIKDIAGKYPTLAKEYLSSIKGFSKAQITMNLNLPGRLGTLPRVSKNISIEVAAD
ncbi:hypothetical protein A2W13_01625 [Candidatus Woesebacteria bacterium RBG_16_36_11]|uniref:Baseplate protein J-like barrel domain-containing protein n=3 Tax=Candidatus Woeseibacteriota TaxID=1752722 RepID=A0A1F7XDC1_9BACT|nr:MAG: hypothetical protein A2Z67_03635 [Candidatus Woesebacteria bacterium RBG_13_36_22]OGM12325.1 MAG: hypothetical protein A2W13_01625 [Candidatus Woesebacteria bacterium RBG_16_36_11]OGM17256.1 MAG: hypothetical protein A2V55_01805 [Candidatus Woesebacteria bacterium RBG_19FT_COMBO_37_29]